MARGFIYVIVGVLAAQLALGSRSESADQQGALAEVADKPFGQVLLVLLAVGFAGYILWRVARAIWGEEGEPEPGQRVMDLGKAVLHLGLLASTIRLLTRDSSGSEDPSQSWTAEVMAESWGRWAVGAVGLAIVGWGLWQINRGLSEKFRKHLERHREWVVRLGVLGHVARGAAFAVIGGLVLRAAVVFDPNQPIGLDHALREVADAPFGTFLLLAVAVGLIAFGAYSMAESQDRQVLDT